MTVQHLTDSDFATATSSGTVLIDFYADWCGPCQMQGQILEHLATAVGDAAVIAKLDVDRNPQTPARYGVSGIPHLVLFQDGQPIGQFVGLQALPTLQQAIQAAKGASHVH